MRSIIVLLALAASSAANAQATAPPTPDTTPPQSPAPQAEGSDVKSTMKSMYEDFRSFKEQLPFRLGAGVYLFYYQPLDYTTFSPTDRNGYFQVYAFYLKLDKEVVLRHGAIGAHAEIRMRDGGHVGAGGANQYLRSFFSSNIWFQELYAYYRPWSFLNIKAGKIYRKVGIFWDDSFFGNIQYFDGNKLVPDWGVSFEGNRDFVRGKLAIEYSAQYFYNGGGTNGSLDYGRTLGAPETAPTVQAVRDYSPTAEGATDSAGTRMSELEHGVDARLAMTLRPNKLLFVTAGVSGLNARVARVWKTGLTLMPASDQSQFSQLAGELTIGGSAGPVGWRLIGEVLRQFGPGMRDADYVLAGAKATWHGLAAYLNCSYVRYALSPAIQEYILQPGITYTIGGGLAVLVEYDEWQRKDPRGVAFPLQAAAAGGTTTDFYAIDRSVNVVLAYSY
jgi:hypothetical protein